MTSLGFYLKAMMAAIADNDWLVIISTSNR